MKTTLLLATTLGLALSATACKKKESEEEKMAKALEGAMKDLGKSLGSAASAGKAAAAKVDKAAPALELAELSLDAWGIKLQAPKGASFGDAQAVTNPDDLPVSTTVKTEPACGVDVDLNLHPAKGGVEFFYKLAKEEDGLTNLTYLVDEKTDAAFKLHFTGKAPIGQMYGVSTGTIVGDRLLLCSSGMNRMTEQEAACVYAVCSSIAGK